jgi:hypothetical protein
MSTQMTIRESPLSSFRRAPPTESRSRIQAMYGKDEMFARAITDESAAFLQHVSAAHLNYQFGTDGPIFEFR